MAMSIDRVLSDAINGAQKGLQTARRNSAQLAAAGSGPASNPDENKKTTRVEKAPDADLGKLVDVKA